MIYCYFKLLGTNHLNIKENINIILITMKKILKKTNSVDKMSSFENTQRKWEMKLQTNQRGWNRTQEMHCSFQTKNTPQSRMTMHYMKIIC